MGTEFILEKITQTYADFNSMTEKVIDLLKQSPETTTYWDRIQSVNSIIIGFAITLAVMYFLCELMNKSIDIERISYTKISSIIIRLLFCKEIITHSMDLMLFIFKAIAKLLDSFNVVDILKITIDTDALQNQLDGMKFTERIGEYVSLQPNIIIITIIGLLIYLIVYGRLIQLSIYTAFSPIPLANLAAESQQGNAVRFLKEYASVCFQSAVIILALTIYSSIVENLGTSITETLLSSMILLFLIIKSGDWSKKILGIS